MSPAVVLQCRRPVAAVSVLLTWFSWFSLLLATVPTVQGSALLQRMHNGHALAIGIVPGDSVFEQRWDDPVPGTKAFAGFQQRGVIDLARRDCLPNGTNFCFGDSVNFCASCGTCCIDGIYCCGAGGICCGTGCCASGQTCDSGKCVSSAAPITITAISYQTVTRTVTQIATVVVVVVDTSTIVRETEVTVSNEQTQTNIIWVTETVLARRGLPTAEVRLYVKREDHEAPLPRRWWASAWRAAWGSIAPRNQLPQPVHDAPQAAPLQRRQATQPPGPVAPVPTVTKFVTEIVESTRVISETITTQSTSIVLTTVIRTNTKVLNARTTIDVTSILTITNHEPVTQVITTTESPIHLPPPTTPPPRTPSPTSTPSTLPAVTKSSSIQTPAIVGISIGGLAAAAILAAIVIFWFRYRRHRHPNPHPNADLPPNVNDLDMMGGGREPTYPALKHFVSQRTAAHHSAQFHPPPPDDPHKSSGGSSPLTPDPRASSLYSTPGVAGGKQHRVSAMTEYDGVDRAGSVSPAVSSVVAARGSRRLSQQHVQQYQQQYQRPHSYSVGSQNQYAQQPPPPQPEELDSTPVMEMGNGVDPPPVIPPRLRPNPGQHLRVVNGGDQTYDGASWGDPNSPGLQGATVVGRASGTGPGPGPLR
ncbi:hypothetical protein QBC39DRAFT_327873 [Podospora conica]|nr:hypothetical protein QBC39DRAFT_327873 [Schizothecium conicum]